MGYKVYYNEIIDLQKAISDICMQWSKGMSEINERQEKLSSSEALKGNGAESIRAYLDEVHEISQGIFSQMIVSYLSLVSSYTNGYYGIDNGAGSHSGDYDNNVLISNELENGGIVNAKTSQFLSITRNCQQEVNHICRSISDLVWLSTPNADGLLSSLERAQQTAFDIDNKVRKHESEHSGDLNTINELLSQLMGMVKYQLSNKRIPVASYVSGGISNFYDFQKLQVALTNANNDIKRLEGEYENAMAVVQAAEEFRDFEIREEQAKWIKIGIGVLAAVGTIVATVATGGAAAVVICAAIGATSAGFSNITDKYIEKGSGTDFFGNVFSDDFYSKFTFEDWASFGKDVIVGGISGAITGAFSGGSASVSGSFTKKFVTNVVENETQTVVSGMGDIAETIIVDKHKGKSSEEIWADVRKNTKATVTDCKKTLLTSVVETGLDTGFDKFNDKIGLSKLSKKSGGKVITNYGIKPLETVGTDIVTDYTKATYDYFSGEKDSIDHSEIWSKESLVKKFANAEAKAFAQDKSNKYISEQTRFKAQLDGASLRGGTKGNVEVVTFGDGSTGVTKEAWDMVEGMSDAEKREELGVRSVKNAKVSTVNKDDVVKHRTGTEKSEKANYKIKMKSN